MGKNNKIDEEKLSKVSGGVDLIWQQRGEGVFFMTKETVNAIKKAIPTVQVIVIDEYEGLYSVYFEGSDSMLDSTDMTKLISDVDRIINGKENSK